MAIDNDATFGAATGISDVFGVARHLVNLEAVAGRRSSNHRGKPERQGGNVGNEQQRQAHGAIEGP